MEDTKLRGVALLLLHFALQHEVFYEAYTLKVISQNYYLIYQVEED